MRAVTAAVTAIGPRCSGIGSKESATGATPNATALAGVALSRLRLLAVPAWRAQISSTRRRSMA